MMAKKSLATMVAPPSQSGSRRGRTAIGVGVTTLITVLVVMLLATFAVLSLASSRADMSLTNQAVKSTTDFYTADGEAASWYADLDAFLKVTTTSDWETTLDAAGYKASYSNGELQVNESFAMGTLRELTVTIAIASDGTPTIRQWQSVSIA